MQPDRLQRAGNFRVAHEPAPDVAGAQILGAENCDADVNPDYVGIDPAVIRVKGVGESVPAVNFRPEFVVHRA